MLSPLLFSAFLFVLAQQPTDTAPVMASDAEQAWVVCPQTPALHGRTSTEFWFEGTFGTRAVRLYLNRVDHNAIGTFYSTDDWHGVSIGGTWSPKDRLTLGIVGKTGTESSTEDGLAVHVSGDKLLGAWKQDPMRPSVLVDLHRVPRPLCDGRGFWASFSDKRWPIEFSYPADWHVEASESEITITCPDPFWMAYEGVNITLSKSPRSEIPLMQCGDRSIFGSYSCIPPNGPFGSQAVVTRHDGVTRFTGWAMEHRLYCKVGGYVGQGDGEDEVLNVGSTWIDVSAEQDAPNVLDKINASIKKAP
jgi:hypothetical protein